MLARFQRLGKQTKSYFPSFSGNISKVDVSIERSLQCWWIYSMTLILLLGVTEHAWQQKAGSLKDPGKTCFGGKRAYKNGNGACNAHSSLNSSDQIRTLTCSLPDQILLALRSISAPPCWGRKAPKPPLHTWYVGHSRPRMCKSPYFKKLDSPGLQKAHSLPASRTDSENT